nr:immunoglobulin heavy chain junction region [Mus musculus]
CARGRITTVVAHFDYW